MFSLSAWSTARITSATFGEKSFLKSEIKKMEPLDKEKVVVSATIEKADADFIREGTRFWLIKPVISLEKITGKFWFLRSWSWPFSCP